MASSRRRRRRNSRDWGVRHFEVIEPVFRPELPRHSYGQKPYRADKRQDRPRRKTGAARRIAASAAKKLNPRSLTANLVQEVRDTLNPRHQYHELKSSFSRLPDAIRCKDRPDPNRKAKGRGGGITLKTFVPWCTRRT